MVTKQQANAQTDFWLSDSTTNMQHLYCCVGDSAVLHCHGATSWIHGINPAMYGDSIKIWSNKNGAWIVNTPTGVININIQWVSNAPQAISGNVWKCPGMSQNLIGQSVNKPDYFYLWSTGETTPQISVSQPGIVTCIVKGACATVNDSYNVSNYLVQAINLRSQIDTCAYSFPLSAPAGFNSYQWADGSPIQTITVSTSGKYYCTVTDGNGCHATPPVPVITTSSIAQYQAYDPV